MAPEHTRNLPQVMELGSVSLWALVQVLFDEQVRERQLGRFVEQEQRELQVQRAGQMKQRQTLGDAATPQSFAAVVPLVAADERKMD